MLPAYRSDIMRVLVSNIERHPLFCQKCKHMVSMTLDNSADKDCPISAMLTPFVLSGVTLLISHARIHASHAHTILYIPNVPYGPVSD